jgi:hypothetical protein
MMAATMMTATTMTAMMAATSSMMMAPQVTRRKRTPLQKAASSTSTSAVAKKGRNKKKTKENTAISEPTVAAADSTMTSMMTTMTMTTPMKMTTTPMMKTTSSSLQCAWLCHKPCNLLLPVPDSCSEVGCCKSVHPICQLILERKNNFEAEDNTLYCPDHHQIKAKIAAAAAAAVAAEATTAANANGGGKPSTSATIPISCVWSNLGVPCKAFLPPPIECTIHRCTKPVHHICVIDWEVSIGHEGLPCTVCPDHHEHYQLLARQTKSTSSVAAAAAASAAASAAAIAATAANCIQPPMQVFPSLPDPSPPLNTIGAASFTSPADSTLTEIVPPPPRVPPLPDHEDIDFGDSNIDSWSPHEVLVAEDAVPPDDDNTDRDGGDSDNEGEMSGLHIIAVAWRMINDNECNQVESSEDAERIML